VKERDISRAAHRKAKGKRQEAKGKRQKAKVKTASRKMPFFATHLISKGVWINLSVLLLLPFAFLTGRIVRAGFAS
jgi:hypothetical protein